MLFDRIVIFVAVNVFFVGAALLLLSDSRVNRRIFCDCSCDRSGRGRQRGLVVPCERRHWRRFLSVTRREGSWFVHHCQVCSNTFHIVIGIITLWIAIRIRRRFGSLHTIEYDNQYIKHDFCLGHKLYFDWLINYVLYCIPFSRSMGLPGDANGSMPLALWLLQFGMIPELTSSIALRSCEEWKWYQY